MSQPSTFSNHAQATSPPVRYTRGRGPQRNIKFTIVFDQIVEYFDLCETASVSLLESIIEARLKVPVNRQFIYGWPADGEPANKSVTFRELNLPEDTLLHLAVEGPLEPRLELEVIEDHVERANAITMPLDERPGTSRRALDFDGVAPTPPDISVQADDINPGDEDVTFDFTVEDAKNGEVYDDVLLNGNRTVQDVKSMFQDITCIPLELQEWSGWPESANDNCRLKDIGLDTPIHSLILKEREVDNASSPPNQISSNSNSAGNSQSLLADIFMATPAEATTANNQSQNQEEAAIPDSFKSPSHPVAPVVSPPPPPLPSNPIDANESPPAPPRPKVYVAKKSTTKGSLYQLQLQLQLGSQRSAQQQTSSSPPQPLPTAPTVSPETSQNRLNTVQAGSSSSQSQLPVTPEKRFFSDSDDPSVTPKRARQDQGSQFNLSQSPSTSPRKKECHIFKLPDHVVSQLLQYLDPVTELSLRRTCKTTRSWVTRPFDTVTKRDIEKWERFSLSITETDFKTLENAANLSLPITRFIFQIDDDSFYDTHGVDIFIASRGLLVRKLTLRKFYMFQNPGEVRMLRSFHRLEQLTLDVIVDLGSGSEGCPSTLRTLQVLKLNYEIEIPQERALTRPKSWLVTWGMLSDCASLLYFRFPRINEKVDNPIQHGEGIFAPLLDYIQMKTKSQGVALEYLDLKHFDDPQSGYITRFNNLLDVCHTRDIKLKNVHSLVIQEVTDDDIGFGDERFKFCENVVSLINYCPFVENAPLRNIEKFKIDIIPSVRDYATMGKAYKDIFWPKLKTIKLMDTVHAEKDDVLWANWQIVQEDLYGLTGTFDRGSVEYVKIDSPKLPYFLGEGRLAQKFVNLKRLDITAWSSKDSPLVLNKRLWPIWSKLRLEELRLENISKLNDNSFIGNNLDEIEEEESEYDTDVASTPKFLALRKTLVKMTLNLDGVNDVTDRAFIKVFSKMKLKHFTLISSNPVNISERALLQMQNGTFGQSIEHFPFATWSSSKIDPGRFERLGKKFRSRR